MTRVARSKSAFTLLEVLVVLAVIGILIALLLPAHRGSRTAARRSQCKNNLQQIMLALHQYEEVYDAFPPAFTVDARGRPLHSWRTLILPYLDQRALYHQIDLAQPWDSSANAEVGKQAPLVYQCPHLDAATNLSTYFAIAAPNGCFAGGQGRKVAEITDGISNTLMLIEAPSDRAVPWMAPFDADQQLVLGVSPDSRLSHDNGVHAARVDGSVVFVPAEMPAAERLAQISIAGNDSGERP